MDLGRVGGKRVRIIEQAIHHLPESDRRHAQLMMHYRLTRGWVAEPGSSETDGHVVAGGQRHGMRVAEGSDGGRLATVMATVMTNPGHLGPGFRRAAYRNRTDDLIITSD